MPEKSIENLDALWQQYTDGLITWKELTSIRETWGLNQPYITNVLSQDEVDKLLIKNGKFGEKREI